MEKRRLETEVKLQRGDGREAWDRMGRGWIHGARAFRQDMLAMLEESGGFDRGRVEDGEQVRDHGEEGARATVAACLAMLELTLEELQALKKTDERKALVGDLIKAPHSVSNRWISEQLRMGDQATVSRSIRLHRDPPAPLQSLARRLTKYQES